MLNASQFVGSKIYVYEQEKEPAIAETTITEIDLTQMVIKMRCATLYQRTGGRVTVLMLLGNAVYEYRGTLRRSHYGMSEIALYQGKRREKRGAIRFAVQSEAKVDTLLAGEKLIPLKTPISLETVNISTSGAKLQGKPGVLQAGACFQLRMNIGPRETLINSTIVWVREVNEEFSEYGCAFTALSEV